MGYDTFIRVYALNYYEESYEKMQHAIDQINDNGCDFLVAGRLNPLTNAFETFGPETLEDVPLLKNKKYRDMVSVLPDFRNDLSSTLLRKK